MIALRIVGVWHGEPTEWDGKYIVDYDPTPFMTPDGPFVHLVVTDRRDEAREFPTLEAAVTFYRRESTHGPRPDGKPDRPLTAYTVEFSA
jgi:hypothetical protein